MNLCWGWGWEIDAVKEKYQDADWTYTISDTTGSTNFSDSAQPLIGYGGGDKCLRLGSQGDYIQTPGSYVWQEGFPPMTVLGDIAYGNIQFYWKAGDGCNLSSTGSIINLGVGTDGTSMLGVGIESNKFWISITGSNVVDSGYTWSTSSWYRIDLRWNVLGGGQGFDVGLYINSVLQSSGSNLNDNSKGGSGGLPIGNIRFISQASGSGGPGTDISHYFDHISLHQTFLEADNNVSGSALEALYIQGLRPNAGGNGPASDWQRSDNDSQTDVWEVLTGSVTYPTPTNWAYSTGSGYLNPGMQNTSDVNSGYLPNSIKGLHQISYTRGDGVYVAATSSIDVNGPPHYEVQNSLDQDGSFAVVFTTGSASGADWTYTGVNDSKAKLETNN